MGMEYHPIPSPKENEYRWHGQCIPQRRTWQYDHALLPILEGIQLVILNQFTKSKYEKIKIMIKNGIGQRLYVLVSSEVVPQNSCPARPIGSKYYLRDVKKHKLVTIMCCCAVPTDHN
jgi:hypothetical protein